MARTIEYKANPSVDIAAHTNESLKKWREASDRALAPIDQRIQDFLSKNFAEFGEVTWPSNFLELDRYGMARQLSIPEGGNFYKNEFVTSYKLKQGVLHNNKSDRRTTAGVFHVSEGGLPITADKVTIPQVTYYHLLKNALQPSAELSKLPYNNGEDSVMLGLQLHPLVSPEVEGVRSAKYMEIRFLVPAAFASNLDFVESIFGNTGNPALPENNLIIDPNHFIGVTGAVVLAPQLLLLTKKELGIPHYDDANELQKKQGVYYKDSSEKYNNGSAFKICFRNEEGLCVTIIADNYFGYCKKEVKTQIGFAANLSGEVEEEHAGGALVFPSYNVGEYFQYNQKLGQDNYTFEEVIKNLGDSVDLKPEGYAIDKNFDNIYYMPEDVLIDAVQLKATWAKDGVEQMIRIQPEVAYVHPSGYQISLQRQASVGEWTLVGTVAEGCLIHKPSTVSGGGKSEISKSLRDAIIHKNLIISDFQKDMAKAEEIIEQKYGKRFKDYSRNQAEESRDFFSPKRSVGSIVKLLTPSEEYTDGYNEWLATITKPQKALAITVKKYYRKDWNGDWRSHFNVDMMDGVYGNEIMFNHKRLISQYLRMSTSKEGQWKTFRLRQDFVPAAKIQQEDDITASIVLPQRDLPGFEDKDNSLKFVKNCEYRLFQRPDDAVHRGYDKQTELDFTVKDMFCSNFQALTPAEAREMLLEVTDFDRFSEAAQGTVKEAAKMEDGEFFVSSDSLRIMAEGGTSKNPRYLQDRPDLQTPGKVYLANQAIKMSRKLDVKEPALFPVDAVIIGRRNNAADHEAGIKALSIYNPLHYQELPEFGVDFIATLTGKSPSTTGFGSEGALTKSPFNCIRTTADLNNAIVGYILTGYAGFSGACGFIGSETRVDHDISYWIPEIWARLKQHEKNPERLIKTGCLEKVEDYVFNGREINASRIGYRITKKFMSEFAGRIFVNPDLVFPEDVLKPELQNQKDFAEGVEYVTESQASVAKDYFADGSIEEAGPQLTALLHIMAYGEYESKKMSDPAIRALFDRENLIASDWYQDRLTAKQRREVALKNRQITDLTKVLKEADPKDVALINSRMDQTKAALARASSPEFLKTLNGGLGADLMGGKF